MASGEPEKAGRRFTAEDAESTGGEQAAIKKKYAPPPCFCVCTGIIGLTGEFLGCTGMIGLSGYFGAGEGLGRSELAQE